MEAEPKKMIIIQTKAFFIQEPSGVNDESCYQGDPIWWQH